MRTTTLRTTEVNWGSDKQVLRGFIGAIQKKVKQQVEQELNQGLEEEAGRYLGRAYHERRDKHNRRQTRARCQKCGSRRQRDFSRNGHRRRQLVTLWGVLTIWLPRLTCQCGGSVKVDFSLLGAYQRLWEDVDVRVEQWAEMGLSLRQMQTELNESLQTNVGLRVLNERLQAIKQPVDRPLTSVPPVVMLDAIWVTVLRPTGHYKQDKRGRIRPAKSKHKVPVWVAIGVWPQSGKWEVLDWELATREDEIGWTAFLERLETRGVYRERGLELLIHDGGKGVTAALKKTFPFVPRQRWVFHKLRNIWQAIAVPADLNREQAAQFRRDIIRQAAAIYRADTLHQALDLRDAFRERWQPSQPVLVATLFRDWHDTITFYKTRHRFPDWPLSSVRTTSQGERVNRKLHRLFRAANAYHSDAGLLAATARVLLPLRAV